MNRKMFSLFLILQFSTLVFAQDQAKEVRLGNQNVSMSLVKKRPDGTSTKINWPDELASLTSATVLTNGQTINKLLRNNNIWPDVEAFGIVYALNPEIKNLQKLEVDQLNIPKIKGGEDLQKLLDRRDAVVFLTVDKQVKIQFSEEVKALSATIERIKNLPDQDFVDTNTKTNILNSLTIVFNALKGINTRIIQRVGRFIPTEVIKQLSVQAHLLNTDLIPAILPQVKIGKLELEEVTEVREDIEIKRRAFSEAAGGGEVPSRYPDVSVVVRTLRDGKEIPGLRISYVAKALKNKPQEVLSFGELSSPASGLLPEGNYCFWATNDTTGAVVSNNPHCHPVLDGQGTIRIELTVKPR